MKSDRRLLIEEVYRLLDPAQRQVDMAVRLRVHRKGPRGEHHPPAPRAIAPGMEWPCPAGWCETRDEVIGGRWDRLKRVFVDPTPSDLRVAEIGITPGQLAGIEYREPGVNDVLLLGAPRGSKTSGMVIDAVLDSLRYPTAQGGLVAPTNPRLVILWDEALLLLGQLGWVAKASVSDNEIHLHNESCWKFVAAQPASKNLGNPIQGFTWAWAKVDERQNVSDASFAEVMLRGASYGESYRVKSSATNQDIAPFQRALEEYRTNATKKLIPVPGKLNSFIADSTWEAFRLSGNWSESDYNRIINAEVIPAEGLIYKAFDYELNIPKLVPVREDITEKITLNPAQDRAYSWVIGHDFGWQVNASVMLKAYEILRTEKNQFGHVIQKKDRIWFVWDELQTRGLTAAEHAAALIKHMRETWHAQASDLFVVGDPHTNKPDTDESDYAQFRKAGLTTVKAYYGGNIDRKHRFSMVNAMLGDSAGVRRLFIARDGNGHPRCPKLIESFKSYCYAPNGQPEQYGKDSRRDPSHTSDAVGYGIFRWEKLRGSYQPTAPAKEGRSVGYGSRRARV